MSSHEMHPEVLLIQEICFLFRGSRGIISKTTSTPQLPTLFKCKSESGYSLKQMPTTIAGFREIQRILRGLFSMDLPLDLTWRMRVR